MNYLFVYLQINDWKLFLLLILCKFTLSLFSVRVNDFLNKLF